MTINKESVIQLSFLDEAQQYLDILESRVMGLAEGFSSETIREALRAAHSLKGGAGLMGLLTLGELAHRLEDGLKVLKIQRDHITVDVQLEQQLLVAVDCMGEVVRQNRQHIKWGDDSPGPVDRAWLQQQVEPIFAQLHERLGEPEEEDFYAVFAANHNPDIIPLLFQSEVADCLQRLERLIAGYDPCLREELVILAQELGGLGEMLQIEPYTRLCQSIEAQIATARDRELMSLAQAALATWQYAQDLVLNNNLAAVPDHFLGQQNTPPDFDSAEHGAVAFEPSPQERQETPKILDVQAVTPPGWPASDRSLASITGPDAIASSRIDDVDQTHSDYQAENLALQESADIDFTPQTACEPMSVETESPPVQPSVFNHIGALPINPNLNSTVQVSTQQINQLSDLCTQLMVERNGLEVELECLRQTIRVLKDHMHTLNHVNEPLQNSGNPAKAYRELSPSPEWRPLHEQKSAPSSDVWPGAYHRQLKMPFAKVRDIMKQCQAVENEVDRSLDITEQATHNLGKTSRQLQKSLTQLRMCPLAVIFDRFPQALRQMSLQYNKPVELHIEGENTLVDHTVLEALHESLMHIIRNGFDHGIENAEIRQQQGKPAQGRIALVAQQQNNRTIITIRDDGGGIPLDKIRDRAYQMGLDETLLAAASKQDLLSLIFELGFSTASQVTNLSGRGIGMDVVRNRLKAIRGEIQVDTEAGVGTVFTISIPSTLSSLRVLITESHGMYMAFPVDAIKEVVVLPADQIPSVKSGGNFLWHGERIKLVKPSDWLHFNCPVLLEPPEVSPGMSAPVVLLVQHNQRLVGIQIERSWGEHEVALRQIVSNLPLPVGFNGCTLLADGRVVPLVSVPDLLHWIASCEAADTTMPLLSALSPHLPAAPPLDKGMIRYSKPKILLVDDSTHVRRLMTRMLESAGYRVVQAEDGQDALDRLIAGLAVQGIICDVEMPHLDGYGFLSRLKAMANYKHIPVAMLTCHRGSEHQLMAMNLGAAAYFTKPYDEQNLLRTLGSLVHPSPVS